MSIMAINLLNQVLLNQKLTESSIWLNQSKKNKPNKKFQKSKESRPLGFETLLATS